MFEMMLITNGNSTEPHCAPSITTVALPPRPSRRNRTPIPEPRAEEFDGAVVKWENAVRLRFVPPTVDERLQLLGVRGGEVVALRPVARRVVELPGVVVERRTRRPRVARLRRLAR
jgi:hypothetical protein